MAQVPYVSPIQVPANPDWRKAVKTGLVRDMTHLIDLLAAVNEKTVWGVDTETTDLDFAKLEIVGFSFCYDMREAWYVPLTHLFGANLPVEAALGLLYAALCRAKKSCFYNAEYDLNVLHKYGLLFDDVVDGATRPIIQFHNEPKQTWEISCFDAMVLSWNVDVNLRMPSLKDSVKRFCGIEAPTFEQTLRAGLGADVPRSLKQVSFRNLHPEQVFDYAACDPYFTMLIVRTLWPFYLKNRWIIDLDQDTVDTMLRNMEVPIPVDIGQAQSDFAEITQRLAELEQQMCVAAGRPFNPGSDQQREQVLLELGLDTGLKTKGGEKRGPMMQTGGKVLSRIADKHPLIPLMIEHAKEADRLEKVEAFIRDYNPEIGGVRFPYKLMGTRSGRFSAGEGEEG